MRKSETQAPFTFSEAKSLLKYLDYSYNQTTDCIDSSSSPTGAQLPSQSSMKTALVSWVLLNVGMFVVLYHEFPVCYLLLLAKHCQTTEYGRKLFQNADQLALTSQPGVLFRLISTVCFFAPIDQHKHICSANGAQHFKVMQKHGLYTLRLQFGSGQYSIQQCAVLSVLASRQSDL